MSQKSILAFFKTSSQNTVAETKNKCVVIDDSPVRKTRNKRKVQCIESDDDDESSDISSKYLNDECSKASVVSDDEIEKSSDLNPVKVGIDEVKRNNDFPSRKPSKQKKMKNDKEANSESPTKLDVITSQVGPDVCNHSEHQLVIKNDASTDSCSKVEEPSSSNQNGVVDFIPKRKTARKQMSSAKDIKRNLAQVKEESKTDNAIESKSMPTSNETTKLENKIVNVELNVAKGNLSASEKSVKHETNTVSKNKGSPQKKCAKKESIHSFFTSVKREDAEDIKSGKSCHAEKEDSPIKKIQKKKVQCLESDEENNESASEEPSTKNEAECTEMNEGSPSSQKNKDNEMTSEKVSKLNKTLIQKLDGEKSKDSSEKQKFAIKSTSAVDTVYDPSKHNYHPIEDAFWKRNEKVPYLALAKTLALIENTSGRLKAIEILSNYLRSVIVLSPDDLLHSVYLCLNRVAPEYEGIEMGVGETLLMKAVAQATGRTLDKIKAEVAVKGDLGLVSESSRGNQRVMFAPPKLTVSSVFNKFLEIAKMSGNAAMAKKTDKIKSLFVACRDCEAKYIIRSLNGKLRIGLAEQSVLSAIARAVVITPPGQVYPPEKIDATKGMSSENFKELLESQTLILKTAYCECPNYDLIIPVLLQDGISALPYRCQLSPGIPLKPMLAHPAVGIDKVLERFDKNAFTCEFKYDGERAQIHMNDKGEVKIFSRNQENNTSKYPDIISRLPNALKESTKSFILDSEAVAWDKETKQILPFQVLSTRKRKDAVESEIVVQVCIVAFDLLYLNGESLVKKSLKERRNFLHSSFNEVENQFMFAQYKDGNSAETMQEFLDESVKGNCEGLMVKSLEIDASYEIAKRSHNWLKLKKDYLQGIGDTLDLVVIGGYYGKGKRTGSYGGFLLACYDEENEEYQSICKLGTGFKEPDLETHTTFLKQHVIKGPKSYFRYDHSLEPDDWFEPVQVWEIKCADLSISPVHKAAAGIIDPEKGISLRFPRFVRIRDDKTPENATNSVQIADMYQKQEQIQNTANKSVKIEEDYY